MTTHHGPVPRLPLGLVAAEKTGRVCRGVELDPPYVGVILRGFEAAGKPAVLAKTGEAFEAQAARRMAERSPPGEDSQP